MKGLNKFLALVMVTALFLGPLACTSIPYSAVSGATGGGLVGGIVGVITGGQSVGAAAVGTAIESAAGGVVGVIVDNAREQYDQEYSPGPSDNSTYE